MKIYFFLFFFGKLSLIRGNYVATCELYTIGQIAATALMTHIHPVVKIFNDKFSAWMVVNVTNMPYDHIL